MERIARLVSYMKDYVMFDIRDQLQPMKSSELFLEFTDFNR